MANNQDYLKKAKAQEITNEALQSEISLVKTLGTLLQSNLKTQGRLNDATQDRARMLQGMIDDDKNKLSTDKKISNIQKDIANATAKIAKANAGDKRIKVDIHKANLKIGLARLAQLKIEQKIENVTSKIKKSLTVAGILGSALTVLKSWDKTLSAIGGTFGSINQMGSTFVKDMATSEATAIGLGFGMDDVATTVATLSTDFGISVDEAAKLNEQILETAKATGLSVSESTELFGLMEQITGQGFDQVEALTEGAFQLARANKVNPSAPLKDIAKSSQTVASFTKDTGENLFEAAIQARMFGLNLETVAQSARGMLNFQDSIRKETEASVMLGKTINLQRARELALSKDLTGFTKELKSVLEGTDFTTLDPLTQESVAGALNMQVDEVQKLLKGTKTLKGTISGMDWDDLAGQEAMGKLESMIASFNKLTKTLTNALGPSITTVFEKMTAWLANQKNIDWLVASFQKITGIASFLAENIVAIGSAVLGLKSTFFVLDMFKIKAFRGAMAAAAKLAGMSAAAFGPLAAVAFGGILAGLTYLVTKTIAKPVNDFKSGPGGINFMSGPAGAFTLNPKDSVLATTNPIAVNDAVSIGSTTTNKTSGQNNGLVAVLRGKDVHFITNNRPLTGGDTGFSPLVGAV